MAFDHLVGGEGESGSYIWAGLDRLILPPHVASSEVTVVVIGQLGWAAGSMMASSPTWYPDWSHWKLGLGWDLAWDCDGSGTVASVLLDFLHSGLLPRKRGSRRPRWKLKSFL